MEGDGDKLGPYSYLLGQFPYPGRPHNTQENP